jgi:hypothetical protein
VKKTDINPYDFLKVCDDGWFVIGTLCWILSIIIIISDVWDQTWDLENARLVP